jgi:hypothetical protein
MKKGCADPKLFSAHRDGRLPTNAKRSGHRGPPPRHPVSGPWRTRCSVGRPTDGGWADPNLFSAHWDGDLPTKAQRGGHRGPRSRRVIAGSFRTVALDWMPSGSGILNSTGTGPTAFDRQFAALKGLKRVAGGSAIAVPPDSRPPHGPNPGRGSRGHGTTPCTSSRPPHQAATGRPYNRFSTCWSKGHRPAASTVDRHLTPQRAQTTATQTPNPRTHRHSAERVQNQPRGSADLRVRPLGVCRQTTVAMGREQIGIGLGHLLFGSDSRRPRIRWSGKTCGPFALTPALSLGRAGSVWR